MAGRRRADPTQDDLFSVDPGEMLPQRLDERSWPDQSRFPVNRAGAHVRTLLWQDLVSSARPLIVAGYSSIGELVDFVAAWLEQAHGGQVRLVLGTEPFATSRRHFGAPGDEFTEDVTSYWLDRGVSLRLSAKVIRVIEAVDGNQLSVRYVHGRSPLHAKVYVGHDAATVGSSNFTRNGLATQIEGNARFEASEEPQRFHELEQVAENLWEVGQAWDAEFRGLLEQLLKVVTWREALARACSELLEGEWAEKYVRVDEDGAGRLWPSQRLGIAQAMWIIENVGSVLVADATGSGKTRMGAHLVRAVRDRLWATGRVRRDLTVLVCPPAVENTWRDEAVACGLSINTVSHGKLSRSSSADPQREQREVRRAQLLAVDEAHNFLNPDSKRTQYLRDNVADHVMLFTATPISRSAADLLDLVALLGPDNFDDATLDVLSQLGRRGGTPAGLSPERIEMLRGEIQRFTLRRTKSQINRLVDQEPESYRHPVADRVCRYPRHVPNAYPTGETETDIAAAQTIRAISSELLGVALLPTHVDVPKSLRSFVTDEQWLKFRLTSAAGLARHHVLGALRSSGAALLEHLLGTRAAADHFGLPHFKQEDTGDTIGRVDRLAGNGPPAIGLDCDVPEWLAEPTAWQAACVAERERYEAIRSALAGISPEREQTKARLLADLAQRHDRVLAFDHHLITLTVIRGLLEENDVDVEVLIATGQSKGGRDKVEARFAPTAQGQAIALCSDAMNEGLNLQGAAAIVHLDLPTTLRVAEQRVGRVDRMDSPHEEIEAWWPRDGDAFATRANERLAQRVEESESLLGSNLPIPELRSSVAMSEQALRDESLVTAEAIQAELERAESVPWDGITDALEPVRQLVEGPDALLSGAVYEQYRRSTSSVVARVAPLRASSTWAFLSVRSTSHGVPRWILVEPAAHHQVEIDLARIVDRLRLHLRDDPPDRMLDDAATIALDQCLSIATVAEHRLMPRRLQRALDQMGDVLEAWAAASQRRSDEQAAVRWRAMAKAARPSIDAEVPDPFAVAERWLELISPVFEQHRAQIRRNRYVLIRDITKRLVANPMELTAVEAAMSSLPMAAPLAERVSACILGVPE